MIRRTTGALMLGALLTASARPAAQAKPDVALRAAMETETMKGDLKGAIEQYRKIAATSDRAIAASALIHMAECYQKLGDMESKDIYQRVIRDFTDQAEAVTIARRRLADSGPQRSRGVVARNAWVTKGDVFGNVSPDGRYVPYMDYNSGLTLHDLETGTDRLLTDTPGELTAFGTGAYSFSRDGKQLAYSWLSYDRFSGELRVVSLQGSGVPASRRLGQNEEITMMLPHDWSPDGKWIAVALTRKDRSVQIGLLSTQNGFLQVLKSIDWRLPSHMYFSPDGKYLAFDLLRDVYILAVDGSREIPAIIHPGADLLAGWAPDGSRLLFTSDRGGSTGLWALSFAGGDVQGGPELIKRDIGESMTTAGITKSGALYSVVYPGKTIGNRSVDILQAAFDFTRGTLLSAPGPAVETFVGTNRQPSWSPDGKYLAHVKQDFTIAIRSLANGATHDLALSDEIAYLLTFVWTADSSAFFVVGTDVKGRDGIFRVDLQTGRATLVVEAGEDRNRNDVNGIASSPDGRFLYHVLRAARKSLASPPAYISFVKRDLAASSTTELIRRPNLGPLNLSPDGQFIATTFNDTSTKSAAVLLIPTAGGEPTELMREPGATVQMWAPDSKSLFVRKGAELWRAPVDGGAPSKLDVKMDPDWGIFRVHPDGKSIAIQTSRLAPPAEVWVLENFLAEASASK